MKRLLKNKKGAEIPVFLFIFAVVFLLFMTIAIAFLKKNSIEKQVFGVLQIQESYSLENAIKYSYNLAFKESVEEVYSSYAENSAWISKSCGLKNGYKNLCDLDPGLKSDLETGIKEKLIMKIINIQGANFNPEKPLYIPRTENDYKSATSVEINDYSAIMKINVYVNSGINAVFYSDFFNADEYLPNFSPYEWGYYKYDINLELNKKLSEDYELDSFQNIDMAVAYCGVQMNKEYIETCMNEKLENFDTSIKIENKDVYFDLTSKKDFNINNKIGKIKIGFFITLQ